MMNMKINAFVLMLLAVHGFAIPRYSENSLLQKFLEEVGVQIPQTVSGLCGVRNVDPLYSENSLEDHGEEAQFGEFPWQSLLLTKDKLDNWIVTCAASVIGSRWVLTAGVCVDELESDDILVRVGEKDEPLLHVNALVEAITILDHSNPLSNVAVLELSKPLDFQYYINSICLPNSGQEFWGQHCIVTGWSMGKTLYVDTKGQMKKEVQRVLSFKNCDKLIKNHKLSAIFDISGSISICAIGAGDVGSCTVDAGGPLACRDPSTGQYILTGVATWGLSCSSTTLPDIYADVQAFVPFIRKIMTEI